jgi:hypothetical protein
VKNIAWWWWFRFLVSAAAIVAYNAQFHPHGPWAFWLSLAVGIGVAFALDGCRAGYRYELREKQRRKLGGG